MSVDWNYVLKRVLVGLLIFVGIFLLKKYILLEVKAETLNSSSICVLEGTNSTCNPPPVYRPFPTSATGVGFNVWFQQSNLTTSNTSYNYEFRTTIVGLDIDDPSGYVSIYVGNNGVAGNRAYADRNEVQTFYKSSTNEYTFIYSFGMDTLTAFDTIRFSWYNNMSVGFNGQPVGIKSATLTLTSSSGGSGSQTNQDIINNSNNNTQNVINNNNQNTQNIINNNSTNTQEIIDNQNENSQKEIESQKVCKKIDKSSIVINRKYLNSSGQEAGTTESWVQNFGITDYYSTTGSTFKVLVAHQFANFCFYNVNKSVISCPATSTLSVGQEITIPSNASFIRFTINTALDEPQIQFCQNGNQALQDSLTDDSISSDTGEDFFSNFNYGDESLSSVITAPLRMFNRMTDTCSPITLTWLNTNIILPCGDTIFWNREDVQGFRSFWNILFGGVMLYFLGVKLFKVVNDALDPMKDSIESVGVN